MIMARNEDGTYSQVGFVKDNAGIDTEYIYDKDGDIVFEKGFTRETSGTVPLTINGIGKDLKDWSITGNTVQNGTPTPENIVEVLGCGDYDSETGLYRIPVVTKSDGAEPITTPIYLPTPLYSSEVMRSDGSREVKWKKLVLTGKENAVKNSNDSTNYLYYISMSGHKKINGFCSHLIGAGGAPISIIGFNMNSTFSVLYLNFGADIMKAQSSGNTVKGFKEYLAAQYAAGTPITLWYQLAEPTTETFTAPQIPTLNGTTVIDVDTAVKPTEMYTKYKSSK